ncbi:MAG: phenylalanine--tRNA ligase subunit beta [Tenericutes bacterium HGW-Tenericutes-6]|nr:MAG: phenylalanine--tRNA ligase subunit beta [Tenericutes bacterium HGW-Tenericutes-6]
MKIIENILKDFIDIPKNILEITNQKIIEVDAFYPMNEATNLIIGKVLTCDEHPNSDHLHVTTVDLGDRVEQIVCGAPNVGKDQYVIVAQVGSVLPGNFQIKASKIRGVESNGMICSLKELGIDDKNAPEAFKTGIYFFDQPQKIGSSGLKALHQEGFVMELGLTPNRADLLSHYGFALDLGSMLDVPVKKPSFNVTTTSHKNPFSVDIKSNSCARYYARYFEEVTIKESPWWLKSALIASDIQPINNVVDISNYVLIEYGTPLHMFDADKIGSKHILVRDANPGEEVITLDDQKRKLIASDLVITNGKEPIALAGVMGLASTMIDEHTKNVVLEAAYFEPKTIQNTVKRLGLRSESSLRFERGIDDERVIMGLERATELLIELADAKVSEGISTAIHHQKDTPEVEIEKDYINRALGTEIKEDQLLGYFKRLNYQVKNDVRHFILKAPSYRQDLEVKADFVEEIARIYGLDLIPTTPIKNSNPGKLSFKQKRLRSLRHDLAAMGLNEVITYSLLDRKDVHRYHKLGEKIEILSPLSDDKNTLRQSLIHGLLESISYNQSRQTESLALFEIGHVFAAGIEKTHLAIALSGLWQENTWKKEKISPDFYLLKGLDERLFDTIGIAFEYQKSSEISAFHPHKQADILLDGVKIGVIAELHPNELKQHGIEPSVVAEIDLTPILSKPYEVSYQPISKYPNISRDLAVVVSEEVTAQELLSMIKQTVKKNLVSLKVFDVYQGTHIEKGKKSIAFSLVFNDQEKTLGAEDVDQMMKKITNRLSFSYQAEIRK